MSRRRAWFGRTGRGPAEYFAAAAAEPPPGAVPSGIPMIGDAELVALVDKTAAENRALTESRERLQAALDAAVADISIARAEAADARRRSSNLEERLAALTASLTEAENHTAGQCLHVGQARALRVLVAAMQDRLSLLQAANEAHDTFAAGGS